MKSFCHVMKPYRHFYTQWVEVCWTGFSLNEFYFVTDSLQRFDFIALNASWPWRKEIQSKRQRKKFIFIKRKIEIAEARIAIQNEAEGSLKQLARESLFPKKKAWNSCNRNWVLEPIRGRPSVADNSTSDVKKVVRSSNWLSIGKTPHVEFSPRFSQSWSQQNLTQ